MSFSANKVRANRQLVGSVSPDQPVSQDSHFRDSTWNLSSLIHVKNLVPYRRKITFDCLLPDGSWLTDPQNAVLYVSTKEFCYWRLQGCPPIRPANATSVHREFFCLRALIFWMVTNKKQAYSQLSPHHIEVQFLNFLRGNSENTNDGKKARSGEQIVAILNAVQRLWDFRQKMGDSLTFNPFKGKRPCAVLGVKLSHSVENKTPIIPDEIMTPLGNKALDYVYVYSNDILNARARVESVRETLETLNIYQYARGIRGNIIFGFTDTSRHAKAALEEVSITNSPDTGEPWREPFSRVYDLYREETNLFTACYVVIAWLTGMRDSEITSLSRNCLQRVLSEDGVIERLKIKGTLFKGVRDPRGREETWVTIEPVAKAIDVLTRLTPQLRTQAQNDVAELLFLRGDRNLTVKPLTGANILVRLKQFAKHVGLPLVNGTEWRLGPRQFRRTLARWIARRPFGELAGMIQFKHLELATFEGYVGHDPEFHKDLLEEKLLANIDLLEDLKNDALEGKVAGPKAPELIDTFRGIAGDRRPDDQAYMLKHLAKTLYVGMFNLCFYDPAYAMCQQHMSVQERKSPITSHCQPDRCPNSCITKQHLGAYQDQLNESRRLLKTPKLPLPQRIALEQENARIERVIEPLLNSSEQ